MIYFSIINKKLVIIILLLHAQFYGDAGWDEENFLISQNHLPHLVFLLIKNFSFFDKKTSCSIFVSKNLYDKKKS